MDSQTLLALPDAARESHTTYAKLWTKAVDGSLPVTRIGGRWFITRDALRRYIAQQQTTQAA